MCVNWTDLNLQDALAGDHLIEADLDSVPARGARVTVIRPYPESAMDVWLGEDGCITYESQFPSGHKLVVHAEAVIGFGTNERIHVKMHEDEDDLDAYMNPDPADDPVAPIWQVHVPAMPQDPEPWSIQVDIPNDETQLVTLLATASEVLHRLHYDLEGSLITGTRRMRIALDPNQANAFARPNDVVLGTAALRRKFILAHEIGHWIQLNVATSGPWTEEIDYNYGPDSTDPPLDPFVPNGGTPLGVPWETPCRFAVADLAMNDSSGTNPNRHGIRGAEFSTGAMPEGFGHFVAAAAFNDPDTTGIFRYYKDIDEELLPDYVDFEANDGDVALEGGAPANTLGGASRWTELYCEEDWRYPLQSGSLGQEVTTEIDWLRFFWQFSTPAEAGTPTFWDTVRLVTFAQDFDGGWSLTDLWPHLRDAIDEPGSGLSGYTARFEDVTIDNGVYNEPP